MERENATIRNRKLNFAGTSPYFFARISMEACDSNWFWRNSVDAKNKLRALKSSRSPSPARRNRAKPMSSHPEADQSSARDLVTDSDFEEYENQESRRKPIISINGEDVPTIVPPHRRIA